MSIQSIELSLSKELERLDKEIGEVRTKFQDLTLERKRINSALNSLCNRKGPSRTARQGTPKWGNIAGLRMYAQGIDYSEIAEELYGVDNPSNRSKVYARRAFWKKKGWLVKDGNGHWRVTEEIKRILGEDKEKTK